MAFFHVFSSSSRNDDSTGFWLRRCRCDTAPAGGRDRAALAIHSALELRSVKAVHYPSAISTLCKSRRCRPELNSLMVPEKAVGTETAPCQVCQRPYTVRTHPSGQRYRCAYELPHHVMAFFVADMRQRMFRVSCSERACRLARDRTRDANTRFSTPWADNFSTVLVPGGCCRCRHRGQSAVAHAACAPG